MCQDLVHRMVAQDQVEAGLLTLPKVPNVLNGRRAPPLKGLKVQNLQKVVNLLKVLKVLKVHTVQDCRCPARPGAGVWGCLRVPPDEHFTLGL